MKEIFLSVIFVLLGCMWLTAQNDSIPKTKPESKERNLLNFQIKNDSTSKINFSYGSKGWEMNFNDKFLMRIQWRLQFRFTSNSTDPLFFVGEEDDTNGSFSVQRARLKVGGFAYQPYIKWYLEYDFPSAYLLNWEFTFSRLRFLQFKLGQWKIKYNIERFISSGKQQLVERSISNRFFTFDRQIGVSILGDFFVGKPACSSYNIGVFNGNGRMQVNDDGKYLFFVRYQWNFSRKVMKLSFSDLDRAKKPEGFIAFNYARNLSAYTRFSSDGGGELPGYEPGEPKQYLLDQFNLETMLKYKGFSFSNENHIKNIDDKVLLQKSQVYGGYVMAGYFFSEIIKWMPKKLEMVGRYAMVSDNALYEENIYEYTFGLNWFFKKHLNKLTADFSYIENQDFDPDEDNFRFRIQWDVSF